MMTGPLLAWIQKLTLPQKRTFSCGIAKMYLRRRLLTYDFAKIPKEPRGIEIFLVRLRGRGEGGQ